MTTRRIDLQQWEAFSGKSLYRPARLARLCGVSIRQLERDFASLTGANPKQWLDQRRLSASRAFLLSEQPVKRVALEVGFKSTAHFCRWFKARVGLTPIQYILTARAGLSQIGNTCRD